MPTSPGGPLIHALHALWAHIQKAVPDLPPVRIAITSALSPPGHGPERWQEDEDGVVTGLVITASTLREGADATSHEVLHHAAHLLNWRRNVADTAARGAYHNARFLDAAAELGLALPAGAKRTTRGFADVEMTPETHARYAADVAKLAAVIPGALPHLEPPPSAPRARGDRITLRCGCEPKPRAIKVGATVAALGPIVCGVCKKEFLAD
ncbi:hypothetical protein [Streptomyces sp. R44]|uniref:SprT-like family protein n=1 Tax=Streptomyces sp. R44 TaxID=3238633 RepID=A0AB39T2F7_9ACTN